MSSFFLGDIPTYGKSGNRDEDEDMLDFEKETVNDDNSDDECKIIETSGWNTVDPKSEGLDANRVVPQVII